MLWVLIGAVLFLLLHRALEGMVCDGENGWRRKFKWDLATGAIFLVGLATAWVVIFRDGDLWESFGGILIAATPVMIVSVLFFSYLSKLVHDRRRNDVETG